MTVSRLGLSVALWLCGGLACSAGATQYADEERERGVAAAPVPEFGVGAPPASAAASDPVMASGGSPTPVGPTTPAPADADVPAADPPRDTALAPVPPGAGGAPAAASASEDAPPVASGEVASTATCTLAVSVTTVSPGGRYAPRNVGAIWVADAEGRFIKSLHVWGDRRLRHVEAWNTATEAAGAVGDVLDAVTGATEASHGVRGGSWDCRDFGGQVVADGPYRAYFEVTESNGAGPNTFANFTKGANAETVRSSAPSFSDITLSFTP